MTAPDPTARPPVRRVELSPANVWQVGLVVLAVIAFGALVRFVLQDGGNVLFLVLMAWFGAIALSPAVDRLARHIRRGPATAVVLVAVAVLVVGFLAAFGSLFVAQLAQLIGQIPTLVDGALAWANDTFDQSLTRDDVLSAVNLTPDRISALAATVGVNLLGVLGSVVAGVFSLFTFALFLFYLSADMPRLIRWIARLFPARSQQVVVTVWELTTTKTGGYVRARAVLALINAVTSGVVFAVIGLPYWLPLALWTGVVAQFVPTIGTYIAIALPVAVGLLGPQPWTGVVALVWSLVYQQVENLTIEPRINARAVDVHPAVAFGSVLLGAALFGVAGALLAVPVTAMLLSLLDIYGSRHDLAPVVQRSLQRMDDRPEPAPDPQPGPDLEPAPDGDRKPPTGPDSGG